MRDDRENLIAALNAAEQSAAKAEKAHRDQWWLPVAVSALVCVLALVVAPCAVNDSLRDGARKAQKEVERLTIELSDAKVRASKAAIDAVEDRSLCENRRASCEMQRASLAKKLADWIAACPRKDAHE